MQARRDGRPRQGSIQRVPASVVAQQAAFNDVSRQFLDKQRDAVGARSNLRDDLLWKRLARDGFGQRRGIPNVEAIERECADMRGAAPYLAELGAKGDEEQDRKSPDAIDRQIQQFVRGRIDPLSVLENHQYGSLTAQILQPAA
jgi:hypothetical protein